MTEEENRRWALEQALRKAQVGSSTSDVERDAVRFARYTKTGTFDEPAPIVDVTPKTW